MAGWRRRPAARHQDRLLCGRGLQGRRACSSGQGVRALSGEPMAGSRIISTSPANASAIDAEAPRQPFWLDPSDPHRMAAAMQFLARPRTYNYGVASGDWRHVLVEREAVWSKAVHRVADRGHQPRAGGRRGDRPHQADPGGVTAPQRLVPLPTCDLGEAQLFRAFWPPRRPATDVMGWENASNQDGSDSMLSRANRHPTPRPCHLSSASISA